MKFFSVVVSAMAGLLVAGAAAQAAETGNAEAGMKKTALCSGCHGIPGYKTVFPAVYSVPKIGGQQAAYIAKALREYQAGNRSHPTMKAVAAGLSDQDIADLAAYYSGEPSKTAAK